MGIISGTNRAAILWLTQLARQDLNLRAAVVACFIAGQTNLLVETRHRLAEANSGDLLGGQERYSTGGAVLPG